MLRRLCKEPKLPDRLRFFFYFILKTGRGLYRCAGGEYSCRLFVSEGEILGKNEAHIVLLLTPNSFPNTGILLLQIHHLPTTLLRLNTTHSHSTLQEFKQVNTLNKTGIARMT